MKRTTLFFNLPLCLILASGLSQAQFNPDGNPSLNFSRAGEFPINEELIQLAAPYSQSYASVAFLDTIYFVVWTDYRNQETDIYGARLDIYGNLLDPAGLIVCNVTESQTNPDVATNGELFFVVWREERNDESDDDIYGARVTPEGVILDPEGIPICTAIDDQDEPAIACVGNDFCVTWSDYRKGNDQDIYANIVTADGVVSHTNGFAISTSSNFQSYPDVCSDGNRFYIVWSDNGDEGHDIYGTFVATDGTVSHPNGNAVVTLEDEQRNPSVYYGSGQYFISWEQDSYEINERIYGARVDMNGTLLDPTGISISNYPDFYCVSPAVSFDGTNFWVAYAKGTYGVNSIFDILACRVSAAGQVLDPPGLIVAASEYREEMPALAFDGQQMLICRQEARNDQDIYGSFADLQGNITPAGGILVSLGFNNQFFGTIGFDGTNYMAVWIDSRNDNFSEVFAARVDQAGNVIDQEALPVITGEGDCYSPAISFNGTHYLLVWESGSDLFGARMTTDGQVMAPGKFVIYQGNYSQANPAIAYDGVNWMVVWDDYRNSSGANYHSDLFGTLISPDGVVLQPEGLPIIAYQEHQQSCSMVFDGTNYILVWEDHRAGIFGEPAIYGARVTPDGTVLDGNGIALAVNEDLPMEDPVLSYSGGVLMTCFTEGILYDNISEVKFVRFTPDMNILDPEPVVVNSNSTCQFSPVITSYNGNFLVIWVDNTDALNNHIEMAVINTDGVVSETGLFAQVGEKMFAPALLNGLSDQVFGLFSSFIKTSGDETINAVRLYGKQYGEGTGINDEPVKNIEIIIMPNPTQGKFQITNSKFQTKPVLSLTQADEGSKKQIPKIEVVNLYGNLINEFVLNLEFENCLEFGFCDLEFDITGCPAGIYFVRIEIGGKWIVKKLIKL